MKGINRVIIAGNLTRDPDVRVTVNKNTYARFGIAINTTRRNANGEFQEQTEFVNVVVWGAQADSCGKFLRKGSPVLIEGRISTSSYEAKDGSGRKTTTDVTAETVLFLNSGQQQNSGGSYQRNYAPGNYQSQPAPVQSQNNSRTSYGQPPNFDPPADTNFGQPIGEGGFGDYSSNFLGGEENTDIPF